MIFSIEASTTNLSLALLSNNQVINKVSITLKNELSEIIIPTIKKFLKDNSITFQSISLLIVGCGPGSFTSLRAVISAAKGIYLTNKHIKVLGINSLAGLAMSALNEAKKRKIEYILASIDTKRNDQFLQLFKVNNCNEGVPPFSAINNIEPIKLENLHVYIEVNNLLIENFLFVGFISNLLKNKSININFCKESTHSPDAVWVGKLGLCITNNNINYKNSKIAFDEPKPIYVRSPEIN